MNKWVISAALLALVAACSSKSSTSTPSDDGGTDGGSDAAVSYDFTDACTKFWTAVCTKGRDCQLPYFLDEWATTDACIADAVKGCKANVGAPGSNVTPDIVNSCVPSSPTCGQLARVLENSHPAACKDTPGTREDGAPCGSDLQCKGALCRIPVGSTCGICAKLPAAGEPCNSTIRCATGFTCAITSGSTGVCAEFGDVGATCDAKHVCHLDLACVAGKCAAPPAAGTDCDPTAPAPCGAGAFGVYCNVTTKKCEAVSNAAVGAPCGNLDTGGFAFCSFGAHCNPGTLGAPGTCDATIADGQACTDFNGPQGGPCARNEYCHSGVCTAVPDPGSCN